MGNNIFIRGLWGDGPETGTETETLPKTRADISRCLDTSSQPKPLRVYVWGHENALFFIEAAVTKPVLSPEEGQMMLMSRKGIQNFTNATERDCKDSGRLNWGISFWRHKLEAIRHALTLYDAVIWLDWDCHQVVATLPEDLWDRLAEGAEFQASLRRYKRPQCSWRPRPDNRLSAHGAFLYCRSLSFVERAIRTQEALFPSFADEVALSYEADQFTAGWKGADRWKEAGIEPYCYDQRKKHVHQPDPKEVLFANMGRR